MALILGFVELLGAALLLTSAIADASFSQVIKGQAGTLYREQQTSSSSTGSSSSSPTPTPNSDGYVAPFSASQATIGRTDMGVDVDLSPGDAIRAIGKSRVIGIIRNWYDGQPFVWLQLLNGPQAGKYYYVAEQIDPSVTAGQVLGAGEQIGTYASNGTGIEIGWATAGGQTLAQGTTGYIEGEVTKAGQSFRAFLQGLGL